MHGFVLRIDVGQGQSCDANFIAQCAIAGALDHGDVLDLNRLGHNRDTGNPATLIKLSLPLFRLGLSDDFAALLPLPIAHDRPRLRSGGERLRLSNIGGDARNDNRADINVTAQ